MCRLLYQVEAGDRKGIAHNGQSKEVSSKQTKHYANNDHSKRVMMITSLAQLVDWDTRDWCNEMMEKRSWNNVDVCMILL